MKKMTKAQIKQIEVNEAKAKLIAMIEEQDNTTLYTQNLHTSKSGMLRSIKVYLNDKTEITHLVAVIGEYTFHNTGGLKVTGTGMDMGFSVVYDLSVKLYCQDGYTHDNAYKLTQRWL